MFHQEGSPGSLEGTPTPSIGSIREPGLQHPGAKRSSLHKAPLPPPPPGADTHPRQQQKSPEEKPRIPRGLPPERGLGEAGAPAGEAGGGAHRSPGLRSDERAASGSHRRNESPSFAHGVLPKPDSPPAPRPSKEREQ